MAAKTTTEKRKRFENLIEQAEKELAENPGRYNRKVGLLASLGYIYLFGALITVFGGLGVVGYYATQSRWLIYLLISKKLGLGLVFLVYGFIKALWVKLDPPEGYELKRDQCPELFDEVDAIRKKLDSPPIHQILLTNEFNAAISQTPRLGVFGWNKNTLILGLSLLITLPRDRVRAIIAHEFGHLSNNHSRFQGWIYRVRISWLNTMDAFDGNNSMWSTFFFGKFFDWYAPYFNAYSFALARSNEYEADAAAADATSRKLVAEGLIQTYIESQLINKYFWDPVIKKADESPKINTQVFSELKKFIETQPFTKKEKVEALKESLKEKPDHADTHPVLRHRLRPLIPKIEQLYAPGWGAGSELLAPALGKILKDFDKIWTKDNRELWKERYAYVSESRKKLKALEEKEPSKRTNDELWNLAYWTEELKPDQNALPLYKAFWDKNKLDPDANLAMGRLLLNNDQEKGISFLKQSMQVKPRYIVPACEMAYVYFKRKGDEKQAQSYLLKAEKQIDLEEKAYEERNSLNNDDVLLPHSLSGEEADAIRKQLLVFKGVKHAWICRKQVHIFPDEPLFLIVYASNKIFQDEEELSQSIAGQLQFPWEFYVLYEKGEGKKLAKVCKTVGEQLF